MKKNILACVLTFAWALSASAAPNLFTYQGRLKEGGLAVTGNRSVEIYLCDTVSGNPGGCTSTGLQPVAVSNGLFRSTFTVPSNVNLGAGSWWLEIKIGANTLAPREQLTSNAYALFAATAAYAENISAAPGSNGVYISSNLYVTAGGKFIGDGSLLTNLPASAGAVSKTGDTMTGQLTTSSTLTVTGSDGQYGLAVSSGVSLAGVIYTSNGNLGVGTASPQAPLHVSAASGELANLGTSAGNSGGIGFYDGTTKNAYLGQEIAGNNLINGSRPGSFGIVAAGPLHLVGGNGYGKTALDGITLSNDGAVGISSAAPVYRLVVSSGAGEAGRLLVVSTGTSVIFSVKGNGEVYSAGKFIGDGSLLTGISGDNLGNHTATQNLDLAQFSVLNVASATLVGKGLQLGTDLTVAASGIFISTGGAIQTIGAGHGPQAGTTRGLGAVDLQTSRTVAAQVASGLYSIVAGGDQNTASGNYTFVVGQGNTASAYGAAVSGGYSNTASKTAAAVTGGLSNKASGFAAVVSGGRENTASGDASFVGGGGRDSLGYPAIGNSASGNFAAVVGGANNVASSSNSFIGGGEYNAVSGTSSVVVGGLNNNASGQYAAIGGGSGNSAVGDYAAVPGGGSNSAGGAYALAAGQAADSAGANTFTWNDSGTTLNNAAANRTVFKNAGGFVVTGSTNMAMSGTADRGMFVSGNGLVGIATAAPQAALDVVANGQPLTPAQIWRDSAGTIVSSMSPAGHITVKSMGIGTTSPTGLLTLAKAGDGDLERLLVSNGGSFETGLRWEGPAGFSLAAIRAKDMGYAGGGVNYSGDLVFYTDPGVNDVSLVERMRINYLGNVGVSTNAPEGLFQVGGGTLTVLASGNVGVGTLAPATRLSVAGPMALSAPVTVSGGVYTVADNDSSLILTNAVGVTVTLPAAGSYPGRILYLKCVPAVTVNSASANVVPLSGTVPVVTIFSGVAGKWAMLQSDGTNWVIMAGN